MLKARSLLKIFWAKTVICAVFLLNRCHIKAVFGRTLQEAWSGHKVEVKEYKKKV